jgi:hypothetical protein
VKESGTGARFDSCAGMPAQSRIDSHSPDSRIQSVFEPNYGATPMSPLAPALENDRTIA